MRKGWLASAACWLAVIAAAKSARAQPGYPGLIDQTLGVKIESCKPLEPTGCQLCHTSNAGNTTSLRGFGELMVSRYGLISTTVETSGADASLVMALQDLESDNPKLVQDLQACIDPNIDVPNDPVPLYGCSAARGRPAGAAGAAGEGEGAAVVLGLGLMAAAAVRRARKAQN